MHPGVINSASNIVKCNKTWLSCVGFKKEHNGEYGISL